MGNQDGQEKKKKRFENSYFRHGLMIFIVGVLLILTFYFVNDLSDLKGILSKINDVLNPFYIGAIMAYLICPIYNLLTRLLYKIFKGRFKKPHLDLRTSKIISSILAVLIIIAILAGIVMLIVPDLIENIMDLIPKIQPSFEKLIDWAKAKLEEHPDLVESLSIHLDNLTQDIYSWIQDTLIPLANRILNNLKEGALGTVNVAVDFFVALFITIYILNSKEMFLAQTKKVIIALNTKKRAEDIFELGAMANKAFGGFINGKIIDSIIIGILCAIFMSILNLPCVALVSVVIGVTNVIPFFGPFIGAIPMGILMLLIDPIACLKLELLILALQTFDGNFLGPKILGKSTQLSSFWVIFAIIVFGGFFGVKGMVLGVPCFAIIYTYISRAINRKLKTKGFTTENERYYDTSKYERKSKNKFNVWKIFQSYKEESLGEGLRTSIDEFKENGAESGAELTDTAESNESAEIGETEEAK